MIPFKKLTLSDIAFIRPFIQNSTPDICDHTLGSIFIWRDYYQTEYAVLAGSLFFRVFYAEGGRAYTMPFGNNPAAALHMLAQHCLESDEELVLCSVTEQYLQLLSSWTDCSASLERDWCDYLYQASDLAQFQGKPYHGQRNHVNYFKRAFPEYQFELADRNNLDEIREFYTRHTQMRSKDAPMFLAEQQKVYEVLEHFEEYGLWGGVLKVSGQVIAFALGEIMGDTLFVHLEKADATVRGAYQMIVSELASYGMSRGAAYINRGEDTGDLGLRTSKLSYHPCKLIPKYTVRVEALQDSIHQSAESSKIVC